MNLRITTMVGAALLACALTAKAALVSYSVNGTGPMQLPGPLTPPADAPHGINGYPGDTVELTGYTGMLDLTPGSQVLKVNTLLWSINYTYGGASEPWPDMNLTVAANRGLSIDSGVAGTISQTGNLRVNYYNDYLAMNGGATTTFYVSGYQVDVTPLGLAEADGNWDLGPQDARDVMARFDISVAAVPEPTTVIAGALLLLPFGASTLRLLRKNRTA